MLLVIPLMALSCNVMCHRVLPLPGANHSGADHFHRDGSHVAATPEGGGQCPQRSICLVRRPQSGLRHRQKIQQ